MKKISILIALALFALNSTFAASLQEILKSMAERLPEVQALWATQQVGEANNGMMKVLGSISAEQAKTVGEENADRKSMYFLIAQQHGDSVELVAKAGAKRIQEQAPKGTMIQSEDGTWGPKS